MVERPTAWPTNGDYSNIRDWLWYGNNTDFPGVQGFRMMWNPPHDLLDEYFWNTHFLPRIEVATSYRDAQEHGGRIHPFGIDMFPYHEYQGDARAVAFERNRLSALALPYQARFVWEINHYGAEPPAPPDYDEFRRSNYSYLVDYARVLLASQPQPPTEGEPPMPVDYPGAPPLGPGDVPPAPPAGTPDPNSPPMTPPAPSTSTGTVSLGDDFEVSCEFTGRVKGKAFGVAFEDVALFRLPATGKVEVVVKRADVPGPNFFVGSMTDIGFRVTVRRKSTSQEKAYDRPEGRPVEALIYF